MQVVRLIAGLGPVAGSVVIDPRRGRIVKRHSGVYVGASLQVVDLDSYAGRYRIERWLGDREDLLDQQDLFIEIHSVQGTRYLSLTRIS